MKSPSSKRRKKAPRKKGSKAFIISCLLFLLGFAVFLIPFSQKNLELDLSPDNLDQWVFHEVDTVEQVRNSLRLVCPTNCLFLSPRISIQNRSAGTLNWQLFPYIVLYLEPIQQDLDARLVWTPDSGDNILSRPIALPKHRNRIIINMKEMNVVQNVFPLNGPFSRFGLSFTGEIHISRIVLLSQLDPSDKILALWKDFSSVEPLAAYSNNNLYNVYIDGCPLPLIAGAILLLLVPILFISKVKRPLYKLIVLLFSFFFIVDIPFLNALWLHFETNWTRSALYSPLYEERVSRYGRSFADLAARFEDMVPKGSSVFFTRSSDPQALFEGMERNWMEFHFHPFYRTSSIEKADYVFFHHSYQYTVDFNDGLLKSLDGKPVAKVTPIHVQNERECLLRVEK